VGARGGAGPTPAALDAYLELLEPSGLPWSVAVLGGDVVGCGLAELAIQRGRHVRVGLEDYAGPDERSNLYLLRGAVAVAEGLGRVAATTAQTRRILGVPVSRPRA
jgi:3-keto-5-aminohexanoate cleavage enzyme